jgi:hypothetical protein
VIGAGVVGGSSAQALPPPATSSPVLATVTAAVASILRVRRIVSSVMGARPGCRDTDHGVERAPRDRPADVRIA